MLLKIISAFCCKILSCQIYFYYIHDSDLFFKILPDSIILIL